MAFKPGAVIRNKKGRRFELNGHFRDDENSKRFCGCTDVTLGEKFLLKRVPLVDDETGCSWADDLATWSQLRHAHILQYREYWDDGRHMILLCENASFCLHELLTTWPRGGRPCPRLLPIWLYHIASALQYMHEGNNERQPILYRNLRPENILVTDRCVLKICHFASSKRLDEQKGETATVLGGGQALFFCPELRRRQKYDKSIDIWSFGITAGHIADIRKAEKAGTEKGITRIVVECDHHEAVQRIVKDSLQLSPESRPTAADILATLTAIVGQSPQPPEDTFPPLLRKTSDGGSGQKKYTQKDASKAKPHPPPPRPADPPDKRLGPASTAAASDGQKNNSHGPEAVSTPVTDSQNININVNMRLHIDVNNSSISSRTKESVTPQSRFQTFTNPKSGKCLATQDEETQTSFISQPKAEVVAPGSPTDTRRRLRDKRFDKKSDKNRSTTPSEANIPPSPSRRLPRRRASPDVSSDRTLSDTRSTITPPASYSSSEAPCTSDDEPPDEDVFLLQETFRWQTLLAEQLGPTLFLEFVRTPVDRREALLKGIGRRDLIHYLDMATMMESDLDRNTRKAPSNGKTPRVRTRVEDVHINENVLNRLAQITQRTNTPARGRQRPQHRPNDRHERGDATDSGVETSGGLGDSYD